MRLLGFDITRTKAVDPRSLAMPDDSRGWSRIWMGGHPETDFQRDIHVRRDAVLANWAVFTCITRIASDIGKLRFKLVENIGGIWTDAVSAAFSPVLKRPNDYQTWQKFIESWLVSKLSDGNAYILKERDARGVVTDLYVLDPCRVRPLVAPNGSVYYQLQHDLLAGVPSDSDLPAVPADEIIHDTMVCLFHPLCGISPIYANGLAATQGLEIQKNGTRFFANQSRPGGVLSSDQEITDEYAAQLKARWDANYAGGNTGKVAVLGGGLKYQGMSVNAVDSQMVEQLKLTAEMVCTTFGVPPFIVGLSQPPVGLKSEDIERIYYAGCLQKHMVHIETLMDFGLGLDTPKDGRQLGTMFVLDDLMMMDPTAMTSVLKDQVGAGITKIDEARLRLNYGPTTGGDTPYLQQQNYSLTALAKRDAAADPFGTAAPAPPAPAAPADAPPPPAAAADAAKGLDDADVIQALTESALRKAMGKAKHV